MFDSISNGISSAFSSAGKWISDNSGSLISGLSSLAGGLGSAFVSGGFSSRSQRRAMKFNKEQAAIQRNWLENMASTNYQRTREDLAAAGLNPLIALGSPDTVGGGASASVGGASMDSSGIGSGASAFGSHMKSALNSQDKLARSEAELADIDVKTAKAELKATKAASALQAEKDKIELEAIKDDDYTVTVDGKDSNPTRTNMRQMFKNAIERSRFTNSKEHAIAEDTVNAIHGGSSAMQGYMSYQRARALGEARSYRRSRSKNQ